MIELVTVAAEVQGFLSSRNWKFCFIGGLAVQYWAEARVTRDVDLTLLTGFGNEKPFIDALLDRYQPRREDAAAFALRNRVLLLQSENGIGIDVALAGMPVEETIVARAKDVEVLPGQSLRLCTPEDLILLKAFAARPQDWHDVKMTIVRQGEMNLDWEYILGYLKPLAEAKEEPGIVSRLEELRLHLKIADS